MSLIFYDHAMLVFLLFHLMARQTGLALEYESKNIPLLEIGAV